MRPIGLVLALLLGCTGLAPDAAPDSRVPARDPCDHATGHVAALCSAESFDEDCVGFSCARTASRTAVECLLERGFPTQEFVALTRAQNPVTRTYARSALLRRGALDEALLDEALADDAIVEVRGGCYVDRLANDEVAIAARRLPRADGAPFDPIVDRWTHAYGCRSEIQRLEDAHRAAEPAERARLLELETRLRAAQ
jgi:hypothetical protein